MQGAWQAVEFGYAVAGMAVVVILVRGMRSRRFDPFFAIFALSATIYLQVAPGILAFSNELGKYSDTIATQLNLPTPAVSTYVSIQTLLWLLFFLPLFGIYMFNRPTHPVERVALKAWHYRLTCSFASVFALLYLYEVFKNRVQFRRLGGQAAASQLTGLSTQAYAIVRLFEIGAFFLAGPLVILWVRGTPKQKQWGRTSLILVSGCYLYEAVQNSQLEVAVYALALVGWWLVARERPIRRLPVGRIVAAVLALFVMSEIALNVRAVFKANASGQTAHLALIYPLEGKGLHRLDGIDLIARFDEAKASPAGLGPWTASRWVVERYVDRAGYRQFVDTGQTTAKQALTQRDLGVSVSDFYSCCMTDFYGNFGWAGFLLAGVIFGFGYRFIRARVWGLKGGGRSLMVAMFMAASWIVFEQEAQQLLFGWITALPLLAIVLIWPPFTREVPVQPEAIAQSGKEMASA